MKNEALAPQAIRRPGIYWAISDTWELFKRSLIRILRTPDQLITGVILQPILLTVLFSIVFGGSIATGEVNYISFLIPGILVTNAITISTVTLVSVASDMNSGIIDRFRSLPMKTSSILGGTMLSVALRCLASLIVMIPVGLLFGFHPHASVAAWALVTGLVALVAYVFAWLLAPMGITAKSAEGAQQMAGLVWPFFFLSSAFVPVKGMPGWLQGFANNQPLSQAIDAIRALLLGKPVGDHVTMTLLWSLGLLIIAVPLSMIMFKRQFNK